MYWFRGYQYKFLVVIRARRASLVNINRSKARIFIAISCQKNSKKKKYWLIWNFAIFDTWWWIMYKFRTNSYHQSKPSPYKVNTIDSEIRRRRELKKITKVVTKVLKIHNNIWWWWSHNFSIKEHMNEEIKIEEVTHFKFYFAIEIAAKIITPWFFFL